jgi:amino acid transporter
MQTKASSGQSGGGYGTFKGVFVPSILTILGIILYLRLGWVLGNVGLIQTLVIVTIASAITFVTGLSIAATATNMKVGGGGAYYLISRSLGVEPGAAVGLPLFLAQALGISFYIAGFSESVVALIPEAGGGGAFAAFFEFIRNPVILSTATLIGLALIAFFSTNAALRVQFIILILIVASIAALLMGNPDYVPAKTWTAIPEKASFWLVFAVFFPAVTGIEAGIAMSGDLKNPGKSLPWGTLSAVIVGYIVYMTIPVVLYFRVDEASLIMDNMIIHKISAFGPIIVAAIWGASLSSALGAILGAPRTLQALARDRVVPRVLGIGSGEKDEPRIATIVTFIVALLGISLGSLDAIAPILSMFFLTSYGALNMIAGLEGVIANPSWRPTFKTPWMISIIGAFACFAAMFMINAGATIIAIACTVGVYYFMQARNMTAHWGDMRRGILMYLARYSIYSLESLPSDAKTWRPNALVLSGSPTNRWYLIELADAITQGKGFLTVAAILGEKQADEQKTASLRKTIQDYLTKKNVPALAHVSSAPTVQDGVQTLIKNYGVGPIKPNTIFLGETEKEENFVAFSKMIRLVHSGKKNLVIVREGDPNRVVRGRKKNIDIWWGRERKNAGLMLALGYMLQTSPEWRGVSLNLKTIVKTQEEKPAATEFLENYLAESRIEAKTSVKVSQDIWMGIHESSKSSDLIFIGIRPPAEGETPEEYGDYYRTLLESTKRLPQVAMIMTAEEIKFTDIFSG